MSDNLENNPFFRLLQSETQDPKPINDGDTKEELSVAGEQNHGTSSKLEESVISRRSDNQQNAINALIEDVFCITISKQIVSQPLVYIEDTASALAPADKLDTNLLEQALFERLLLDEPGKHVLKPSSFRNAAINHHVIEKEVITYLFECHRQLLDLENWKPHLVSEIRSMDELVIRNVATALSQPELYENQQLHIQFLNIFNDFDNSQEHIRCLVNSAVELILRDEDEAQGELILSRAFVPVLDEIRERIKSSSLLTLNRYHMHVISLFSANPTLGDILIEHSTPNDGQGSSFGNTLIGSVLSTTYLPKNNISRQISEQYQFDRSMEGSSHSGQQYICDFMHSVFLNLFRNSVRSRQSLLTWIGNCLHTNASRGRLANTHENELSVLAPPTSVSDGFMINLCGVLLRLCSPFTDKKDRKSISKLLKIDPTYCAAEVANEQEANERWVHLNGMPSETCLVSLNADSESSGPERRPSAPTYNFLSEIFFMTHKALDIGVRVVFERWMQLNQELARTQRHLETTQISSPEAARTFRQSLEIPMARSLAMRACLLEPTNLALLGDLYAATAEWLIQVATQPPFPVQPESFAPLEVRPLSFPLSDYIPITLSCIPEFLIENVACYQSMVCRHAPQTLEGRGKEFLEPLLSQVLVFVGNNQRMRNPHLRARLAECLESLLPNQESYDPSTVYPQPSSINRESLFKTHPHRTQIVPSLLSVFVGIEMTVEGVSFEQKFNYRRPMYVAMQYLWTLEEQREVFKALAFEAEANIRAAREPLFYHFVRLLMNDAIYLLDEALSNMAQLRNLQNARDNGEWDALHSRDRNQNFGQLMHIGMVARIDNILGRETINTLQYLTTEITSIFCHPVLVEDVANMLNYFLVHLVGPKMKNFKVKDSKHDYEFKPADLVMDICRIYINLGKSDEFCSAVSRDGRSYSPKLFEQAEQVLVRIGGGMLIADLMQVATRVAEQAEQQNVEDEIWGDGPEEFYDPLLSTLMKDPVILPASKIRIDRDTIAKHLLSNQTDPFTKAPLTLDQVVPDNELKERIEAWKNERRSLHASTNTSQENASMDV